jgi:hypothetical protein
MNMSRSTVFPFIRMSVHVHCTVFISQCLKYSDYTEAPKDLSFPASNCTPPPTQNAILQPFVRKEVNIKVEERENKK